MTLWRSITGWLERVFVGGAVASMLLGSGATTQAQYPAEWSMSTLARFPWVWTCVRAFASDLSGLPLVAVRAAPGGSRKNRELTDDSALQLLEHPSVGVSGTLLRKQLATDWRAAGNAFAFRPSPFEVVRLHPSCVRPIVKGITQTVVGYDVNYWDGEKHHQLTVAPQDMIHIRDVSWENGPSAVMGESPIRCLHQDLLMEMGAKSLAAEQAKHGRPDILFSMKGAVGSDAHSEINARWEQAVLKKKSAFSVGRDVTAQMLSWSPREFEFAARSDQVRDTILAVFEVPPARAGLSSANYGTQKQQMRTYWEAIQRHAKLFDDAFSVLAQPGVRIEHDFTGVEALQVSLTEAQMRVVTWESMGADPNEAARYEGFDDAPYMTGSERPAPGLRMPSRPEEPQGDKSAAIARYLRESVARYAHIAEHAQRGVDTTILQTWETERLFGVLTDEKLSPEASRLWSTEIVGATIEAARSGLLAGHDIGTLAAFSASRAKRLSERIAA